MAVVLVHQGPSVTQERYEAVVGKLTGGKSRMESPSDWPVARAFWGATRRRPNGFRVVDVWESEVGLQPVRRDPSAASAGRSASKEQPELYQAHTFVSA